MGIHVGYESAKGPSGGPQPGAKAFMSWYLGAYADKTNPKAANLGIYNPKRLGKGWSIHAEGRACDLGTSPYKKPSWGWALTELLRLNSKELGIQCVIFNGKIWSGSYPHSGWRNYNGSNPHNGHIHVELTWWAAKNLTVEKINAVLGKSVAAPPKQNTGSASNTNWTEKAVKKLPTLKRGDSGKKVALSMGLLAAQGYLPANSMRKNGTYDGIAGKGWESAVKRFQAKRGLTDDGIIGPKTWPALLDVA